MHHETSGATDSVSFSSQTTRNLPNYTAHPAQLLPILSFSWHGKLFLKSHMQKKKKTDFQLKVKRFFMIIKFFFFFLSFVRRNFFWLHQPINRTIVRDHLSFLASMRARSPWKKKHRRTWKSERIHNKGWNWKRFWSLKILICD